MGRILSSRLGPDGAQEEPIAILVIDDDAAIRSLCQRLLKRDGYRVICVPTAQQALRLDCKSFSLVVTDIHMPGMDGISFVRELRKRNIGTPIIVLSGDSVFEPGKEFRELGIRAYFLKPFNMKKFLEAVSKYTRQ